MTPPPSAKANLLVLISLLVAVASAGCGLLGGDAADSGNGPSGATATVVQTPLNSTTANDGVSSVTVLESVFSTRITPDQEATGLVSTVFPAGVSQMHAVLVLEGVAIGSAISGAWYQINVPSVPPDGFEVTRSGLQLTEGQVVQGTARVALNLDTGGRFLPSGSWLLRVFDGDALIATLGFYVLPSGANLVPAPTPTSTP